MENDVVRKYLHHFVIFHININMENKIIKSLVFNDLQKIENIAGLLEQIDQIFHNSGLIKEKRYKELFKIILSKSFDEKDKKGTNKTLDFQISNNTANNIKKHLLIMIIVKIN